MSDYIPTTDRVRADYAETYEGTDERRYARFDRWLAEVKARELEEAADEIESRRNMPGLVHLDVRYAGYYTGIRSGMESDSKALRARAEAYRQERGER